MIFFIRYNENRQELRFIIAKLIDFSMYLRYHGIMEVVSMINRPLYVDKIMAYTDTPFVKVLTGVRRCGKSTVLKMIMEKLQQEHYIPSERIVSMCFDSMDYEDMTAKDMFRAVKEKLVPTGRTYLFLDEVQEIEGWEKVVNSLATDYDVDLYVTGSNSRMMSSEIATYLTGRYVSFRIYTLSFQEYLEFKKQYTQIKDIHAELADYIRLGGFPATHLREYSQDEVYTIETNPNEVSLFILIAFCIHPLWASLAYLSPQYAMLNAAHLGTSSFIRFFALFCGVFQCFQMHIRSLYFISVHPMQKQ